MTIKEIIDTVNDVVAQEDSLTLEQKQALIENFYEDIRTGRFVPPNFLNDPDWQ